MQQDGLVLSSDNRQGFYEIGVYRALWEAQMPPSCVIGRGCNAINGALLATGDLKRAKAFQTSGCMATIMKLNAFVIKKYAELYSSGQHDDFPRWLKDYLIKNQRSVSALVDNLSLYVDEKALRMSSVGFGLITADSLSLAPLALMLRDIPLGQVNSFLLMSAIMPVMLTESNENKTYNTAFLENAPFDLLHQNGYDRVTLLWEPNHQTRRILKQQQMTFQILSCSEYLDFGTMPDKKQIELGYLDGARFLGRLSGTSYYIDLEDKNNFYGILKNNLGSCLKNPALQKHLCALLNLAETGSKDEVQNRIRVLLRRTPYSDKTPVLSMLEAAGKILGLPKIALYTPDSLIESAYNTLESMIRSQIDTILLKSNSSLIHRFDPERELSPLSITDFLAVYTGIVTQGSDFPLKITKNFSQTVSTDALLGMVILIYVNDVLVNL